MSLLSLLLLVSLAAVRVRFFVPWAVFQLFLVRRAFDERALLRRRLGTIFVQKKKREENRREEEKFQEENCRGRRRRHRVFLSVGRSVLVLVVVRSLCGVFLLLLLLSVFCALRVISV